MKHASVDKGKRVDSGCRNNGSCPHCRASRTRSAAKLAAQIKSWEADGYAESVVAGILSRQQGDS